MLVLAIGMDIPEVDGLKVTADPANASLLDADVILVEPSLDAYQTDGDYAGHPLMTSSSSARWRNLLTHWRHQLNAFLESGKTAIFFIGSRDEHYYFTGNREYSGTGRNQKTTNIVNPASAYDLLPYKIVDAFAARGTSMDRAGASEAISPILESFGTRLSYHCLFSLDRAKPLLYAKGTKRVAGSIKSTPGNTIYLPQVDWSDLPPLALDENGDPIENDEGEDVWSDEMILLSTELRNAAIRTHHLLRQDSNSGVEPEWATDTRYRLQAEVEVQQQITEYEVQIGNLSLMRDNTAKALGEISAWRSLLYGNGTSLEEVVRRAMKLLGYSVSNLNDGQSEFDIIFEADGVRFIGEIEGKTTNRSTSKNSLNCREMSLRISPETR